MKKDEFSNTLVWPAQRAGFLSGSIGYGDMEQQGASRLVI